MILEMIIYVYILNYCNYPAFFITSAQLSYSMCQNKDAIMLFWVKTSLFFPLMDTRDVSIFGLLEYHQHEQWSVHSFNGEIQGSCSTSSFNFKLIFMQFSTLQILFYKYQNLRDMSSPHSCYALLSFFLSFFSFSLPFSFLLTPPYHSISISLHASSLFLSFPVLFCSFSEFFSPFHFPYPSLLLPLPSFLHPKANGVIYHCFVFL